MKHENMKIKHGIMKKNENMKLWKIWECQIMNDMRMSIYEWCENVNLWMVWECKNMNDMRM